MPTFYPSAPAVAIIDQNNALSLSFTPFPDPITGLFTNYNFWDIITTVNAGPATHTHFPAPVGYAGGSLTYNTLISSGVITLSMQAFDFTPTSITNVWGTGANGASIGAPPFVPALPGRTFPTALTVTSTAFSSTSLLLGETLTVTLSSLYTGADQWQVLWPDNTNTGWLPLASNVVTKSFSTPGAANVIIQTRRNFSASQFNPPAQLISQFTQQIFVVNQQAQGTSTIQGGLTGDLGIGGQQGFEIVNATSGTVAPEPWEVIARAMVRDSVTSELKLLIATSRFSNASSLLGTMALDVFPIEGRPRGKELIVPPYELTTTSITETVPVKITTTALPTLFVGKSVAQALGGTFQLTAANGFTPYIWSSVGLPDGLTINASGVLNGTPLELGMFNVTIAVQDSSSPFSIDEVTLSLTVETDLLVQIAVNQHDANNTPLAVNGTTLGVARVGTPYNVTMTVGNIDTLATIPGGLPPYTWSAPAGAFPTGLSIITEANSLFGLVSGTPATYNSTVDFNTVYSVTIQVTDSIGAKATQTYSMTLAPEALSFGHLNQTTVYTFEQFKLVVPVFGGTSPYVFVPGSDFQAPVADANFYGTPALVDGQIEIPIGHGAINTAGFPTTGQHSFTLHVLDSALIPNSLTLSFSFTVETQISDINLDPVPLINWKHPLDGSWALGDTSSAGQAVAQPIQVVGLFNSTFAGSLPGLTLGGLRLNLTAASAAVAGNTTYTMPTFSGFAGLVGQVVAISGFANPVNNGTFTVQVATTATQLVVNNPAGDAQAAPNYVLTLTAAAAASGGVTVYAYSGATYGNGTYNNYVGLSFVVAGFVNGANNGTFTCVSSTANHVTLVNAAGIAEVLGATATTPLAKALQIGTPAATVGSTVLVGSVLTNGIVIAVDPTNITVSGAPDAEFYGPAGGPPQQAVYTTAGASAIFRNTEYRIPLVEQTVFPLTSVAAGTGVYSGTITGGAANFYAGQSFQISGFFNGVNNGLFPCTASTATTLTLTNASSIAETTVLNQQAIAIDLLSPEQVSRVYTTQAHDNPTLYVVSSVATGTGVYTGVFTGGAANGFAGYIFTIAGFTNAANNGTFLCTASTALLLTLDNPASVSESAAATATGFGTDIGTITTYTRPYIVGDVVGLNPRKPYYDSANIPAFNGINPFIATVQGGSVLPPGLSLDANTGLIYGTLVGTTNQPSIIQYVDNTGAVHGIVTINWQLFKSDFQLTDQVIDSQVVDTVYNGATAFVAPPGITLNSASAFGTLPNGLSVSTDGTNLIISGTPTEAGYFDCWFLAQATNGQSGYAYHRISTVIPVPALAIIGWADVLAGPALGTTNAFPLPNGVIGGSYVNPVSGNPIALIFANAVPNLTLSGSFPLHGITLASGPGFPETTGSVGLFTGVVAGPAVSNLPITIHVNDSDPAHTPPGADVFTTITIQATALTITIVPLVFPSILAGKAYAPLVTFTGHGSVLTPFHFSVSPVSAAQLPVGMTLSDGPLNTQATIQGTTIQTGYGTKIVTIRCQDTSGAYVDVPYTVTVVAGLAIKTGIDFTDSLSTDILGYVDAGSTTSITSRPNFSFYVVASNVVSTSTAGITVQTNNANITGTVKSLNTGTGIAQIELSGTGFNVGAGSHPVTVTVIDSGVQVSQAFTWVVYGDGLMAVKATNATPTRLTTPT